MSSNKYIPLFYLLIMFLYLSEGTALLGNLKILTLGSHFLFIAISLYYIVKVVFACSVSPFMRAFIILFMVLCLYGGMFALFPPLGTWSSQMPSDYFLSRHFRSLAPVFVFYYFSIKGMINEKWIKWACLVFVAAAILDYTHNTIKIMEDLSIDSIEETTNNAGYYWVALMPLCAFFKKKPVIMFFALATLSILVLSCFKRGAIISAILVDAFFLWSQLRLSRKRYRFFSLLVAITALGGVYLYISYLAETNDYFMYRYDQTIEGYSSSRDVVYLSMWNILKDSDTISLLFGHGADATYRITGKMAHNDWLEYAVDIGILGVLVLLFYWREFGRTYIKARNKTSDEIVMALAAIFIINFIKSMVSMSTDDMKFYMSSILGYCMAQCYMTSLGRSRTLTKNGHAVNVDNLSGESIHS